MQKLTVITPCRNAASFITDCVKSVAAQGDAVDCHLVLDGASNDGTVDVLTSLQKDYPKLRFESKADGGQSAALAKGLAMVETPWFAWLNADDYYLDDGLVNLVNALKSTQADTCSIVYGDYVYVDQDRAFIAYRKQPTFSRWDCINGYLTVLNAAAIFNTKMSRELGGFDTELRFAMDYDLVIRLAGAGKVIHVPKPIAVFRRHEDAKTTQLQDVCREEIELLRQRYGASSALQRALLAKVAKARVMFRMLTQGAFDCRVPVLKERYVSNYLPATVPNEARS